MPLDHIISFVALMACALLGLASLFAPKWASGVVRLVADPDPEKPGGFSEFRATYGGLLLMLHLTAALILLYAPTQTLAMVIVMPIASAWLGAGFGRTLSFALDGAENRAPGMIPVWVPLEFTLGVLIAAPLYKIF